MLAFGNVIEVSKEQAESGQFSAQCPKCGEVNKIDSSQLNEYGSQTVLWCSGKDGGLDSHTFDIKKVQQISAMTLVKTVIIARFV